MPATDFFKENVFPYAPVKEGDLIDFEFELKEGITWDQVEYYYPDCGGCTKARIEGNKILGQVDTTKVFLQEGNNNITKVVYVKINDGQPFYKAKDDGSKQREYNTNVKLERLQIVGNVSK